MGRSDTTAKSAVAKASVRVVKSGSSAANAMARRFAPRLAATNGKHTAVIMQRIYQHLSAGVILGGNAKAGVQSMADRNCVNVSASGHLVHSTAPNASAAS